MEHIYLVHSAKGSSWKQHKYLKVVNGRYYYSEDKEKTVSEGKDTELTKEELIKKLQNGEFGNSQSELEEFYKLYGTSKSEKDSAVTANSTLTEEELKKKKTSGTVKGEESKITADTTDADIIKNALGKDYDSVREKVIAKQQETGRTDLNDDEIKEILGDKYDGVQKSILDQADKREKAKKNTSNNSSESNEEETAKSSKSSKSSSGSSGGSSKSSSGSSGGSSKSSSGYSGGSSKSSSGSDNGTGTSGLPGAATPSTSPTIGKKKEEKKTTPTKEETPKKKVTEQEAMKYMERFFRKYPDFQTNKKTVSKVSNDELKKFYEMMEVLRGK